MKLKLNKKKIKALSSDSKSIPAEMTPQVAGGNKYFTDVTSAWGLTHCVAHTCGVWTCIEVH
ncbi:hypothetical protein CWB73_17070 [Pseudoalteromonas phenolica]|uniref:Uncharacterized protein n=1 Tax=Pseudoalteromonas phenolica TaxID=161398 RepID=A0A5S3YR17_9GAMM|nr:hypothetical protein [Pseudoalteromonas phenolica]TMP78264.1 hypothetical protein CWB73_17070 [Pseudoalteromonas phenolica]